MAVEAVKSIVVGTAGHIDHGKSTLVRALTGIDPDRLKEEKERGITIDLGFAHAEIGGVAVAFVDVPGHERFVKNMLAGVGGIDGILLVVAADESVMPQTREHFDICRLLHVHTGVVAVTKADLADPEMLALVHEEVGELVAGSFLEGAPIVDVSTRTGVGLDRLRETLAAMGRALPGRTAAGAARLPIDRVFSVKGFGTVATGTLVSGRLAVEDELAVLPGEHVVKVRGIQVHGSEAREVTAGHRAAVNVAGVEVADLARGQVLATPGLFQETRVADAVLELLPGTKGLRHGARVRFHQGTAECIGRVIVAGPPRSGGEGAHDVPPGTRAFVRLRLEAPAVLQRGDRYILRAYSPAVTMAGGYILDPKPPRTAIRTAAALERLQALDFDPGADAATRDRDNGRAVEVLVAGRGAAGLPVLDLSRRLGLSPEERAALIARLEAAGRVVTAGEWLLAPAAIEQLERDLLALVGAFHAGQPLSDGMPREEARQRLAGRPAAEVFELVVGRLVAAGRIGGRDRLALASHRLELSPEEQRAYDALEHVYQSAGLKPPDGAALTADAGIAAGVAERMTALLVRRRRLVRLGTMLFHADALDRLKGEIRQLKADAGPAGARIDVGTFKERFGVSRKFAIPLLEYLDRERVTRRVGDARVVL
ncbi:MAG: selenocysteine-specific translation elongation factor [Acidobacteriota bacterium]|nr:selenocysteine-specific translation elongation factor [Acidobacteriota bacterium]